MKLTEVMQGIDYSVISGDMNVRVKDITNDSRAAQAGSLFIAIKGYRIDAHDLLQNVVEGGCSALVVENTSKISEAFINLNPSVVIMQVDSTLEAMAKIASNFYKQPSEKFTVVGITGTNGKTSIAQLLGGCLEANKHTTAVLGTTGNRIGTRMYPTTNTTVESIKLQWLFQEMVNYPVDTCIMEVSSHALKLRRVDETVFDYAIFTNLTEDHLDFHIDMEDYYQTKKQLFQRPNVVGIINIDDAYGYRLYNELKAEACNVVSYALTQDADYRAEAIEAYHDGSSFNFISKNKNMQISIPIPGKIYVYNVLAVLSVLDQMALDAAELMTAVKAIRPVEGRLEIVPNNLGATVVVDYAHTPDALEKVIQVCREFTQGKLVVIFGCGGDRDRLKRPLMGGIGARNSDVLIITSDNPRTEDAQEIINEILTGIEPEYREHVKVIEDRKAAIELGSHLIHQGDTLIIAGKGHETYQIIGTTKHHFDDREEAAKALLYRMTPPEEE